MKEYKKQFEYDKMQFIMCITLNHTVERSPAGHAYHQIITNCLGHDQYYSKAFINAEKSLKEAIEEEELKVRTYVDKKYKPVVSDEEQVLIHLGFK